VEITIWYAQKYFILFPAKKAGDLYSGLYPVSGNRKDAQVTKIIHVN